MDKAEIVAFKAALLSYLFSECQPDRGDVFSWCDDHADEIAALVEPLLAQARAQAVEDAWQPIETAPKDVDIVVFGHWRPSWTDPEPRMAVWQLDSRRDEGEFYCAALDGYATHWRPLPAPPALAQSEGEGKA